MPQPFTPEEQGRLILDAFKAYDVRAGQVLMSQHLMTFGLKHRIANDDLLAGLQYCGEQEWIENGPNETIRLTEKGYIEV